MTHNEMIEVIQAHKDGKKIEWKYSDESGPWTDCLDPIWAFNFLDYRIKPEPREWWVNVYENGIRSYWYDDEEAAKSGRSVGCLETRHVREVLP